MTQKIDYRRDPKQSDDVFWVCLWEGGFLKACLNAADDLPKTGEERVKEFAERAAKIAGIAFSGRGEDF